MDEVEFLPAIDVPATEEPVEQFRPRWRRFAQPAVLAALVVTAGALVVIGAGGSSPHSAPQPAPHPALPTIRPVHIDRYLPWHERAVVGGGGAYIF